MTLSSLTVHSDHLRILSFLSTHGGTMFIQNLIWEKNQTLVKHENRTGCWEMFHVDFHIPGRVSMTSTPIIQSLINIQTSRMDLLSPNLAQILTCFTDLWIWNPCDDLGRLQNLFSRPSDHPTLSLSKIQQQNKFHRAIDRCHCWRHDGPKFPDKAGRLE